jgi:hypothetical protein
MLEETKWRECHLPFPHDHAFEVDGPSHPDVSRQLSVAYKLQQNNTELSGSFPRLQLRLGGFPNLRGEVTAK